MRHGTAWDGGIKKLTIFLVTGCVNIFYFPSDWDNVNFYHNLSNGRTDHQPVNELL